jgi:hypothetical protein
MKRVGLVWRRNRPRQLVEQRPGLKLRQARVLTVAEAGRWRGRTAAQRDETRVLCREDQLTRAGGDSVEGTRAARVQLER